MALVWNSRCVNLRPSEPPVPPSGTLQKQSTDLAALQAGGLLADPDCTDRLYEKSPPAHLMQTICQNMSNGKSNTDMLCCSTSWLPLPSVERLALFMLPQTSSKLRTTNMLLLRIHRQGCQHQHSNALMQAQRLVTAASNHLMLMLDCSKVPTSSRALLPICCTGLIMRAPWVKMKMPPNGPACSYGRWITSVCEGMSCSSPCIPNPAGVQLSRLFMSLRWRMPARRHTPALAHHPSIGWPELRRAVQPGVMQL